MLGEEERNRRIEQAIAELKLDYAERVTESRRTPAVPAKTAPFPQDLRPDLRDALRQRGVTSLFTHQVETYRRALAGENVVITTPTASGKTLCYNLPVLQRLLCDAEARAIYLFPTKALSRDQMAELHGIVGIQGLKEEGETGGAGDEEPLAPLAALGAYVYDGDTPQDRRRAVRQHARIVISNPDMLHAGILPHHTKWTNLFQNLRFVVLDELHQYRGVFGSHLANVMRRLRRVCAFYGTQPTYIASSATIANARELAEKLLEAPVSLIDESGAPRGEKEIALYNPPVVEPRLGLRRSHLAETVDLAERFIRRGLQTIVFARSRLHVEVLARELQERLPRHPVESPLVRPYRGGYLPKERRALETALKNGELRAIVSTNALELGIDIGSLDVAIISGFPGTIASFWQQAGRAGRRSTTSAAILVATSSPLDQFLVRHPDYFFGASPEQALIHPDNLLILYAHVRCAAFELPFQSGESFGAEDLEGILAFLEEQGVLHFKNGKWFWTEDSYPADHVSLRTVTSDNFVVVDQAGGGDGKPQIIGEVDFSSAPTTLHEKAIYLHGGVEYQVESLDWVGRKAYVRRVRSDYFTDAITYTKVKILDVFAEERSIRRALVEHRGQAAVTMAHGEVHVVSQVVGFKKIKFNTMENVGAGDVTLPENEKHTTAFWLTLESSLWEDLPFGRAELIDGLLGMATLLHTLAPLILLCDALDIGVTVGEDAEGWCEPLGRGLPSARLRPVQTSADADPAAFRPTLFLYDSFPGGMGLAETLYVQHQRLVRDAVARLQECECEHGCPSCVGPINWSGARSKAVATRLLERLAAILAGRHDEPVPSSWR
ncbi:MAG: DEAD/DEAH box helicase [Candidatus Schekmanbacteria bacterium]|nr:DEAD/DEAH box helicase [Candidatus Schekmanbacteria bacterium]